ncbi:MAG: large conductance mechanosensitive channel protein MscL [Methanoregulaceae archaeon]|jgi:large conductance mechanosensitive channel|nr:large conductance mechanosensitive channel protein MscL [Methanoregulaceae archaeon]
MLKEFREFIQRGNVMDLAVGVIIGGAFGKIVTSVVDDMLMPLISLLMGKVDFSNKFIPLAGQTATNLADAKKEGAVLGWGLFVNNVIVFVITAFAVFMMVKAVNKLRREKPAEPEVPPAPAEDVVLLGEIRDLLKARG